MTGTFGRLTVIGVQSPVVGATPVVTTGAGFGAAAVVDGAVIVGAITVGGAFAVLSCTSLVKNAAITPPAASAHATNTMANRRRGLRNANSGDDERAYDFGLAGSADRGGEWSPVVEGQQDPLLLVSRELDREAGAPMMRQRHVSEREHARNGGAIGDEEDPDLATSRMVRADGDGAVRDDDPNREVPARVRRLGTRRSDRCEAQSAREATSRSANDLTNSG